MPVVEFVEKLQQGLPPTLQVREQLCHADRGENTVLVENPGQIFSCVVRFQSSIVNTLTCFKTMTKCA